MRFARATGSAVIVAALLATIPLAIASGPEQQRTWGTPKPAPKEDLLVITTTNIKSVTIVPNAARVTCNAGIVIDSDGPIEITRRGCTAR